MNNENEVDVTTTEKSNEDTENTEEVVETDEEKSESESGEKKGKPFETLQAREVRLTRQLEQTRKKLGKSSESKETSHVDRSDLGEKAFLAVNGIKGADELAFFQKMKKETGKDAESLLESTYFQVEFKDFKEKNITSNAIPTGSKRSNNSSVDTVEYWIAKGELPPASEVKLRQDVVNARMKKEDSKGQFYNS